MEFQESAFTSKNTPVKGWEYQELDLADVRTTTTLPHHTDLFSSHGELLCTSPIHASKVS